MDFQLKQWRNQQDESEEQQPYSSAKIPKLEPRQTQPEHQAASSGYALPLFAPEPDSKITMSAFSESTTPVSSSPSATRFPRMGSYFSMSQWQELELQALIFRYMLAGAAVPPELLQPIKKSLPAYFFHHPLQHYPALLQSGYWGRAAMDPEPTRCRRTDGKKWRCSKDVVGGQKYCERHVHRGRNRSRKHVEVTTNTTTTNGGGGGGGILNAATITNSTAVTVASSMGNGSGGGTHFALSGSGSSPPIDLLHIHQSNSKSNTDNRSFFETRRDHVSGGATTDSHVLRPFFDDWPGQLNDADNARNNASSMNSATSLSISLKLSTGNVVEPGHRDSHAEREQPQLNWPMGWGSNQMASMGGPLAEALRSSNSNSSPTSVLHQLPRSSASETSFIST